MKKASQKVKTDGILTARAPFFVVVVTPVLQVCTNVT